MPNERFNVETLDEASLIIPNPVNYVPLPLETKDREEKCLFSSSFGAAACVALDRQKQNLMGAILFNVFGNEWQTLRLRRQKVNSLYWVQTITFVLPELFMNEPVSQGSQLRQDKTERLFLSIIIGGGSCEEHLMTH